MKKIKLAWFYPQQLNLYGDRGNVEIIKRRCLWRDIDFSLVQVNKETKPEEYKDCNLIFMGGGPDSEQASIYDDLFTNKKRFIDNYYLKNGVGLFICGAFQLLGQYYQLADGTKIDGLNLFQFYTKSPSVKEKRLVGNVVGEISDTVLLKNTNDCYGFSSVIGFENHGGRTFFLKDYQPLLNISKGFGNNGKSKQEGLMSKNFICSYLHGPILHLNFHLADLLIAKAIGLNVFELKKLNDRLEIQVHKTNKNLFKS